MLADQVHGFVRWRLGAIRQAAGVQRLVGDRSRVVAHATVDGDVGAHAGDGFAGSHGVERHACGGHQGAPRFAHQPGQVQVARPAGRRDRFRHHLHPLVDAWRIIGFHVADSQASPHVQILHGVAEVTGELQRVGHHGREIAVGFQLEDL